MNFTNLTADQLDDQLIIAIDAASVAGLDTTPELDALFAERKRRNEERAAELAAEELELDDELTEEEELSTRRNELYSAVATDKLTADELADVLAEIDRIGYRLDELDLEAEERELV